MRIVKLAAAGVVSTAMLLSSVTPAMARDHHRGGYGWGGDRWHHRHHDNFNFGDAVGIAALVGAVAIVASSVNKDKKAREASNGAPYPDDNSYRDGGYNGEPRGADAYDGNYDDSSDNDDIREYGNASSRGDASDQSAAMDACAVAARNEASANGGYAEIRSMEDPQPVNGGWNIDGQLEQRASWREGTGNTRRFTCSVRNGQVAEVYLSRDYVQR